MKWRRKLDVLGNAHNRSNFVPRQILMFKPLADTDYGLYFAFLVDPPGISYCPRAGPRQTIDNL
jgi:hypothetical protein